MSQRGKVNKKRNRKSKKFKGAGKAIFNKKFGSKMRKNKQKLNEDKYAERDILYKVNLKEKTSKTQEEKLRSVIEENDLTEFLEYAKLSGTQFKASKESIKIIDSSNIAEFYLQEVTPTQAMVLEKKKSKSQLVIPKRPIWNSKMTKEALAFREDRMFLKWRKSLSSLSENPLLNISPFEKNPEVWRQLWRVLERSDIIVQILDARNPRLFRNRDLEKYVKDLSKDKFNVLLMNKSDLLSPNYLKAWANYFKRHEVEVIFFSAKKETDKEIYEKREKEKEKIENEIKQQQLKELQDQKDSFFTNNTTNKFEMESVKEEENKEENVEEEQKEKDLNKNEEQKEQKNNGEKEDEKENYNEEKKENNNKEENNNKIKETETETEKETETGKETEKEKEKENKEAEDVQILDSEELLNYLEKKAEEWGIYERKSRLIIGFVGYPNVGKSSTINVLRGQKKVAVSQTPGKTKHFQTIILDENLVLCDCPGLVFPSLTGTKHDLVCNGMISIDHLRDYIGPITVVCQRIPREVMELLYGIKLPKPKFGQSKNQAPTAYQFLESYAESRSFMTAKGVPNVSKSARLILKDYVSGRLLYCFPPPKKDFEDEKSINETPTYWSLENLKPIQFKKVLEKNQNSNNKKKQLIYDQAEEEFYKKLKNVRATTSGKDGVDGFTRVQPKYSVTKIRRRRKKK
ncbi:large subunit gtpase 1 [Anaeramoeba flamelloides]|uniref:Large subunit gtpase 1 n=1 Tax=Anaeramoeba flamelloides TaxID=1746091 RepID=A0AAV7Z374_9EUKA|nr:large subunit gtpase 1 [Anaeramoeba flamelloides]